MNWCSCSSGRRNRSFRIWILTALRAIGLSRMPTAMPGACSMFSETICTAAETAGLVRDRRPVSADFLSQALASDMRRFDKGGDAFYDQISALHKSVRGSNPDAALYRLVRMLDGGADPLYLGGAWCAWRSRTSAWLIRGPMTSR